jgi:hypothetical protein
MLINPAGQLGNRGRAVGIEREGMIRRETGDDQEAEGSLVLMFTTAG